MKSIVVLTSVPESYVQQIREDFPGWNVVHSPDGQQDREIIRQAEIIIGWNGMAAEICLAGRSDLRWVHSWGAGVDGMPLAKFKDRNIILTNASGVHANPISETIIALMLSLTRKIHTNVYNQIKHDWKPKSWLPEMHGKTMGLLGVGSIGDETARLAKAFRMRVIGFRRSGKPAPHVDEMVDKDGLDYLVREADYLVNTLPLTPETRHMINQDVFSKMRASAYYINIGRGGTTDTDALIAAVKSGQIAGAGLDVFEEEPLPADSPLWDMPQIIILPHETGLTEHYSQRAMDIFMENMQEYSSGRMPRRNLVDLDRGY